MISLKKIILQFLKWRLKHIELKHFLIILSVVIGLAGGLSAILLKNIAHYTHSFLTQGFDIKYENYLYLAYPLIGILLTVIFIKYIIKDNISHGVSKILYSISKKQSKIKSHNSYSSMVGSTLTVGFGGSVGLEAPIVLTGASIGANVGELMHLNYKSRTLLISCGVAAAIAGIFKAPITAIIFALEVLMIDLTTWSIIPLLISAVTGATISTFLLGNDVVFDFTLKEPFRIANIHFYVLLGIITGLISVYFIRTSIKVESIFLKIKNDYIKVIIGGILLGLLIFLFPPLFGEGYNTLRDILSGNVQNLANNSYFFEIKNIYYYFGVFLFAIILLKVVAMAITNGSGGVGGVFAPSLFIGGITGYLFSNTLNRLSFINLSESNFSLVAMAGMIAGVMTAPLTAIFLIAEITSGYGLFIPLIITSSISYLTVKIFEKHSIYTKRLAKRGELITHHKDKALLTLMELKKVIETDIQTITPDKNLGALVKIIANSNRNIYAVVDENKNLQGIILLDHIRHFMFHQELYSTVEVKDLMITPPEIVQCTDSMEDVMNKFESSGTWNLPVLSGSEYIGFISKSKIFSAYRKMLIHISDE